MGTLWSISRSRPSSVAVLGALNVAELALFGKGLCSASLRRAGHLQHPNFFFKFWYFDKLLQFFVIFSFVRKKVARYPRTLSYSRSAAAVPSTARTKLTSAAAVHMCNVMSVASSPLRALTPTTYVTTKLPSLVRLQVPGRCLLW